MKRKFPNLFIIGAPKCGTTSLAYWLSEHPKIYFYIGKKFGTKVEPRYWATDLNSSVKLSEKEYFNIFDKINENRYEYAGEASNWYLYSKAAIKNIESNIKEPKYIVLIRNPIEMAYSAWRYYFAMGFENIDDFILAFEMSDYRLNGNYIGLSSIGKLYDPKMFSYKYMCSLGTHIENLFKIIDPERILILVLEDIKTNPRKEWIKILEFLKLEDDGRNEFPIYNEGKIPKNIMLLNIYKKFKEFLYLTRNIRKKLGLSGIGITNKIESLFLSKYRSKQMPKHIRAYLQEYFKEEIEKLENILNREFKDWKQL